MKVIELAESKYKSPILFASNFRSLRHGFYSASLSAVNIDEVYPILQGHECPDSLGKFRIISVLDARSN